MAISPKCCSMQKLTSQSYSMRPSPLQSYLKTFLTKYCTSGPSSPSTFSKKSLISSSWNSSSSFLSNSISRRYTTSRTWNANSQEGNSKRCSLAPRGSNFMNLRPCSSPVPPPASILSIINQPYIKLKIAQYHSQCDRQKPRKVPRNCPTKSTTNTVRITVYLVELTRGVPMADTQIPVRKPPRWPQLSISSTVEDVPGVKSRTKSSRNMKKQRRVHLRAYPTSFSPAQFMMIQPRMTPIIPYREVEAPPFTIVAKPETSTAREKIFPPIPERINMMRVLTTPKVYSTLLTRMKVANVLPIQWMKSR